jgi:hypothetical protein
MLLAQVREKGNDIFYGIWCGIKRINHAYYGFFVFYQVLLPFVLGRVIPATYVMGLVPVFVIYSITSALYAVPVAHFIAKR